MIGDTRPIFAQVVGEGAARHPSGRESRLDRDGARDECPEACVPEVKAKGQIIVAYDMAGTTGSCRSPTMGSGKPDGVFAQANPASGPVSSRHFPSSSMPRLILRPARAAAPCRSLMPHPDQGRPRRVNGRPACREDRRRYCGRCPRLSLWFVEGRGPQHCHSARIYEDVVSFGRLAHPSDTTWARKATSGPFLWPYDKPTTLNCGDACHRKSKGMTSNSIRKDETGRLLFGRWFFARRRLSRQPFRPPVWCAHAVGCSGVTLW